MSPNIFHFPPMPLPPPQERTSRADLPVTLSIVTPVLNRADRIAAAVESVHAGPGVEVEHLVLDGGSTDGTLAVLARYPHLRASSGSDSGPHQAMNRGLWLARGEVVGFLGSDDVYAHGALRKVAEAFAADPDLQVVCAPALLLADGPDGPRVIGEIRQAPGRAEQFIGLLFGAPAIGSWFFRRRLLRRLDGFDERLAIAADRDLLLRLALAGHHARRLDRPVCHYTCHPGSRTLDPARRLARAILQEHLELSGRLLAAGGGEPWQRRALATWRASEAARLALAAVAAARPVQVLRILAQAPPWPWRALHALHLRDRLRRGVQR